MSHCMFHRMCFVLQGMYVSHSKSVMLKQNTLLKWCAQCRGCQCFLIKFITIQMPNEEKREDLLHLLSRLAVCEPFTQRGGKSTTAIHILKARKGFQAGLASLLAGETLVANPTWDVHRIGCVLEHWTICYSVFEYITGSLKNAVAVIEQVLSRLPSSEKINDALDHTSGYDHKAVFLEFLREHLVVFKVSLAEYHIKTTVSPLRVLRDPLMTHLRETPDDRMLLQVLVNTEAPADIVGQLRRRLLPIAKLAHTPLPWLFGILSDMMRQHRLQLQQQQMADIFPGQLLLSVFLVV